jgi:hypothetical protein
MVAKFPTLAGGDQCGVSRLMWNLICSTTFNGHVIVSEHLMRFAFCLVWGSGQVDMGQTDPLMVGPCCVPILVPRPCDLGGGIRVLVVWLCAPASFRWSSVGMCSCGGATNGLGSGGFSVVVRATWLFHFVWRAIPCVHCLMCGVFPDP